MLAAQPTVTSSSLKQSNNNNNNNQQQMVEQEEQQQQATTRTTSYETFTKENPQLINNNPSFKKFVHLLTSEFKRCLPESGVDENYVKELFGRFCSGDEQFHLSDLLEYCFFDPETSYTRNLVYENEQFSLLLLVWTPNAKSSVHSHGGSQCWLRVMSGEVRECLYQVNIDLDTEIEMEPTEVHYARTNDTCYIEDSRGCHSIENTDQLSISLHCYAPPYIRCKCYDKDGKQIIGTVTYDSEYGVAKSQSKTLKPVRSLRELQQLC